MTSAEHIAAALGGRRSGNGWIARCPAHEDREPSLSLAERNGHVLVRCHAGCEQRAVIEALAQRGIWPAAESRGLTVAELAREKGLPESLMRESGYADDTWRDAPCVRIDYRDATGAVIAVRYRGADGRRWARRGDRAQLYGLWRLRREPVLLVEGETDCIALWAAGLNAVGVPGASAWRDDRFAAALDGCPTIYVHVEPDEGGEALRAALARSRLRERVRYWTVAPAAKDPCELRARDPEGFAAAVAALIERAEPPAQTADGATVAAEPTPLIRPIPPAAPYPTDALGPVLAPAARAIAEIVQVPDALAAGCVLATAALAAQAHANVQTLGGARPLSLYVLTVAQSGDRKTAADDVALAPVREYERRMTVTYREQLSEWERAAAARKLDRSLARKDAESGDAYAAALAGIEDEPRPRAPWLISSDPTCEGLVRSLADGQYAQGIYTDEGGQILGGHAMSEDAELRTIALLSRLWGGARIDRVRSTDREHLVLYGRRLSIHLLAQPDVAARMLGSPLYRGQGMLARWLIAAPESLAGKRLHDASRPSPQDDPRLRRYAHAIGELLSRPPVEDREVGGLDPPCLALSPEARRLLVAAYDEIERAQAPEAELAQVRDWAAKAAEHACRIAGVLTLVAEPAAPSVSGEAMSGALRLTEHYLSEYGRLVGAAEIPERIRRAQRLLEWLRAKRHETITRRRILQYGPGAIRSIDAVKEALAVLEEHGWVALGEDGRTYAVHPAALREPEP